MIDTLQLKTEPDESNRAAIEAMLLHAYEFAVERGLVEQLPAVAVETIERSAEGTWNSSWSG